jgi:hypothetical protein
LGTDTNELEIIKRLLILQLLYEGVPVEYIGKATGMNPNSIRNMFPPKKMKKSEKSGRKP